jgi:hypothetical protein
MVNLLYCHMGDYLPDQVLPPYSTTPQNKGPIASKTGEKRAYTKRTRYDLEPDPQ